MVVPCPVVVQPRPVIFPPRVFEGVRGGNTRRGRLAEGLVGVLALHQPCTVGERER